MNAPLRPRIQARLIMEAVAILHDRGFGRLKLICYVKEGVGAWRHFLFAADSFPNDLAEAPQPVVWGSLPGMGVAAGGTAEAMADEILACYPQLADASRGLDSHYVSWYRDLLTSFPDGVLEMEFADSASISEHPVAPLTMFALGDKV